MLVVSVFEYHDVDLFIFIYFWNIGGA